ncbi:SLP adapter and CSK-interacting membrane protein isoform X2 [Mirounga angustirostris]|uniref:SLP adapter and CSK-interacting membrane protein isoform X2 n=1 Tax=Mirounga angustirostris TaxID=9716 RepID=UPI0023E41BE3|nr:SLP adapter and CSK-interacting membrane protein isoform X2 [Mirounga angustirostris]
MDTLATEGPTAMDWWRDNFWIIIAVAIILVSSSLGLILYCVCRQLLGQGKKWEVAKPWVEKQGDEEKMYENVNESQVQLPPLPPRGLLFPEHTRWSRSEKERGGVAGPPTLSIRNPLPGLFLTGMFFLKLLL